MSGREEVVQTIEEMAANAWPAPIQQQLEGWTLRAASNVTRRANSVHAVGPTPHYTAWLDEITDFYRRLSLPVRFQLCDASPAGLDAFLEGHDYIVEARSAVYIAGCRAVLERVEKTGRFGVATYSMLEEGWLDTFIKIEGIAEEKKAVYQQILSRIGPRTCYLRLELEGKAVGIGSAACERGWSGLFNIATAPEHRRKGIGREIVRALAAWSLQNGAERLYLQVLSTNDAAISLYSRLGFSPLYDYHYRTEQL
ncbi:MAG: GNAT family N-acetyltransferase [Chloroflexi bacterium]|nr:GNAT family N-acetyltransferase [Chloroflexota bacterium]